ncbi:MAG: HAD family hydrolase [Myxococcales bacterium]|nr:HAD family hydrolase [Myxococcales bacterium]
MQQQAELRQSPPPDSTVAFFDLDRTLLDCNSALEYAKYEQRQGRVTRLQVLQTIFWGAMYHFSLLDIDSAYRKALDFYVGTPSQLLDERTHEWFHKELFHRLRPGAKRALKHHREAGHTLVLITNSSCYLAKAVTEAWELDHWMANIFDVGPNGLLTGAFEPPLCYGEGKVERAAKWLQGTGLSLDDCYFYSDSLSDLPMLEKVGKPVVVNPDPRLRRLARKRAWPIEDWGNY